MLSLNSGKSVRTSADDVGRECHGEERSDPVTELHHEDVGLRDNLVEGVEDANAGRCGARNH